MKSSKKIILILTAFAFFLPPLQSQKLLNRMLKRTGDKVGNLMVEKASDALARAIVRKMSMEMDKLLKAEYARQDSVDRSEGRSPRYADYGEFLKAMNKSADVPPSYSFDLQMFTTVSNKNEKPQDMVYYFAKSGSAFGFESYDKKGNKALVVMDMENDIMVMYNEENGKKEATALPSMLSVGAAVVSVQQDPNDTQMSVRKTGKTRDFAGYTCEEIETIYEQEKNLSYITDQLDMNWPQAFGKVMQKYLSDQNAEKMKDVEGMVLASFHYDKKGKEDSSWVTHEVSQKLITINNGDYNFQDYQSQDTQE